MAPVKFAVASRKTEARHRLALRTRLALFIFALLVVGAPLAFGAVDRIIQVGLLGLFAIGLMAQPAAVIPLSRWGNRLMITLLAILLLKEFAPAAWFGTTRWRKDLVDGLGLDLPWTHHPEPGRAFDALLTWAVAGIWFLWVRTLAVEREHRVVLGWALFAAAAVVVGISFATRHLDPEAIYGLRYTPGWKGFGPFPNRNHTADLLAMGMVLGCGCATWAGSRQKWTMFGAAILLVGFIFVGLLSTQSRGGLLAAGIGTLFFLLLSLLKVRSKRALAAALSGLLGVAALALLWGTSVFGRFQPPEGVQADSAQRVHIWMDALTMWRDAPLFGHGLETFAQLIGDYQTLRLEENVILHPESSWLLWLVELGIVPVLLGLIALLVFGSRHLREAFTHRRGFFLRAGAFSAVAVILVHSLIDVPAHRWGTVGFALAALALACPLRPEDRPLTLSRRTALVPFAIAIFWMWPVFFDAPGWSPLSLTRLLERESRGSDIPIAELQRSLGYFPLSADLHQSLGMHQVEVLGRSNPSVWQRHFSVASRLVPGSWTLPAEQGRMVLGIAPGLAVGYWQQAIERCDLHRDDALRTAVRETSASPLAESLWGRYVEANPGLLLAYAKLVPPEQAQFYYSVWWKERALSAPLSDTELDIFYQNATSWGTRSQFDDWMRRRSEWRARDYRHWARLLHQWGDQAAAFKLLAEFIPEPEWPRNVANIPREQLESRWRVTPRNLVNAQQLALARHLAGETVPSEQILVAVTRQDNPPPWFLQKAAYVYQRQGRLGEAVALLLRTK
ncbi:MAG: hypothetical protein QOE70_6769 [Chthoniobacter sp.]|jgi:O-antigen ligase|nr:hypothetical protein [Chthoniobacter sp.]